MEKPELVIKTLPSGDPILRGACSFCPQVTFVIVGDNAENRRLIQQMFEKHFHEAHSPQDAS